MFLFHGNRIFNDKLSDLAICLPRDWQPRLNNSCYFNRAPIHCKEQCFPIQKHPTLVGCIGNIWEYIVTVTNLHGETINTCRMDLPGVGTWDFDDG